MELIHKEEVFKIVGVCMEVHPENSGGSGFLEIVYKDAIEYEFNNRNYPYCYEFKKHIFLKIRVISG